jgi:hypothetical protein
VDKYADMKDMSKLAATQYTDVTSLEQINRRERGKFTGGYPGAGTREWWALRLRLEELMAAEQRKGRKQSGWTVPETPEYIARSTAAKWAALENPEATNDYQRNGFTREQWLKRWHHKALRLDELAKLAASAVKDFGDPK